MSRPPPAMVGRTAEIDRIRSVLDLPRLGTVLLISGDPGVGKTSLLDAAAEIVNRAGARSLRVAASEYDSEIAFASLNQCVVPLAGHLDDLDDHDRRALSVVLGDDEGGPSAPLVVAAAVLALFRTAAADRSLVILFDDLQWIDRPSAGVLSLVSRRLIGAGVGMLATTRGGWDSNFDPTGLPRLDLRPLDEGAARALLDERFPELSNEARSRVLSEAEGNPLALVELPEALGRDADTSGRLPRALPLTQRLEGVFAARVDELPPATRDLLLAAAVDTTGGEGVLRLLVRDDDELERLAPAERANVIQVDLAHQRVRFRHPLIRSAVVQRATSEERRRAHLALAGVLSDRPDHQALQLADATLAADANVAHLLEESAERVRCHGDYVTAIRLLLRAGDLSPTAPERSRRMARAAYLGALGADIGDAARLVDSARQSSTEREAALLCAAAAGYTLANGDADVDTAHRIVVAAVREHMGDRREVDEPLRAAVQVLGFLCALGMRPDLWLPFHELVGRVSDPTRHLHLMDRIWADPARCSPSDLDELDEAISEVGTDDLAHLVIAGPAAYVDRLPGLRATLLALVTESRTTSPGQAVIALGALCTDGWLAGSWTDLRNWCAEGLRLSSSQDLKAHDWTFRYYLGLLAAAAGETDEARLLADEIGRWSLPRGAAWPGACARHLQGFAAASCGDFEEAYHHFAAIAKPGLLPSHVPHALWVSLDLVESAVRAGRATEARAHVSAMRDAGIERISSRLALLVDTADAVTSSEDTATELFSRAVGRPSAAQWPVDHARARLLFGEHLRRNGRMSDARTVLSAALTTHRQLGATAWAARAEGEIRATGWRRPRGEGPRASQLTPREIEIAQLAAKGMTNKEIGQRLYMSPRTVSSHLHGVFPKLGITSRAALREALDALPSAQEDVSGGSNV